MSERRGQLHTPTTQDHGCTQSVPSKQWYIIIVHVFETFLYNFMWCIAAAAAAAVDAVNVSAKCV